MELILKNHIFPIIISIMSMYRRIYNKADKYFGIHTYIIIIISHSVVSANRPEDRGSSQSYQRL